MVSGRTQQGLLRVAVTGSSGLIGSSLVRHLESRGHGVLRIVRGGRESQQPQVRWRPREGQLDAAGLEGVEAVVHLAGESIFGRWTAPKKERILESRRQGTDLLCRTIAGLERPPRVLVSASAIGYYGDAGDRLVDESDGAGEGFLAHVCRAWEQSTRPASDAGIRTVLLRTGLVLSADGGALKLMLRPFKLGLGGTIGSGDQYMSWIHLADHARVIERAITDAGIEGPVNSVAPNPVTNRQFTKALGRVLRRPTVVPLPAFAARLALGQMAEEALLAGQRVDPKKLRQCGFTFGCETLEQALHRELGS